ncbi:AfsR/SARP family transcriptional regulator [Saccharothrix sp. AJ9571]|nr:AfsR/SARP family transcriptional regulator [Saccharothrix sp. AJ9571]
MDIRVLGPLEVQFCGRSVSPTAAKERKLLAMLTVHAGQLVPDTALFEELWGADVPRSARTTLQTYVLHLRSMIGAAGAGAEDGRTCDPKAVLVREVGGYVLRDEGFTIDVKEFDRLAEAGHRAREAGDFAGASEKFGRALALWRGRALADVMPGGMLEVEVHRLEEARLCVLDRRIDADLRLGRHHELLGELTALVARNPTHEGLHNHLMLALHRAGRRGDAIEVYLRLRTRLVEGLGLEPSLSLRRLHRCILTSDQEPTRPGEAAFPALTA